MTVFGLLSMFGGIFKNHLQAKPEVFLFYFMICHLLCLHISKMKYKTQADDLSYVNTSPIYSTEHPAGSHKRKHCCLDIVKLDSKASYGHTEQDGTK